MYGLHVLYPKPIEKGTVRFRGVRSHFTLWFWLYGIKVITSDCLSENLGPIPYLSNPGPERDNKPKGVDREEERYDITNN